MAGRCKEWEDVVRKGREKARKDSKEERRVEGRRGGGA